MTCSKCGAAMLDGARFCGDCGAPNEGWPVTGGSAPVGADKTPRNDAFAKTLIAAPSPFAAHGTGSSPAVPKVAPAATSRGTGDAASRPPTGPTPSVSTQHSQPAPAARAGTPAPVAKAPPAAPAGGHASAAIPTARDLTGQMLNGRYLVKERIGEGGFGAVYRGEQVAMGRQCAIKVLHGRMARDPNVVGRFRREAQAASALRAAHTVQIYDFDQTPEGLIYLAMELLHGRSLHHEMQAGPMPAARVAHVLDGICDSLGEAHAHGVVHRDIKPENIFLETRGGDTDFAKVLDFGIAKIVTPDQQSGPQLTAAGQTLGTVEYMSPEQLMGQQLDGRSDLYALGNLAYELLTGHLPFPDCRTPGELITAHLKTVPVPPGQAHPELRIPPLMDQIVLRLLQKQRDARYANAAELQADLRKVASAPLATSAPKLPAVAERDVDADAPTRRKLQPVAPRPVQPATKTSSNLPYVAGGVVLLLAVVAAVLYLLMGKAGAAEPPPPARMIGSSCESMFAVDSKALRAGLPASAIEPLMGLLRPQLETFGTSPEKVGKLALCADSSPRAAQVPRGAMTVLVVDLAADRNKFKAAAESPERFRPATYKGVKLRKGPPGEYAWLPGDRLVLASNTSAASAIDLYQGGGVPLVDGAPAPLLERVGAAAGRGPAAFGWTRLDARQQQQLDRFMPGTATVEQFAGSLNVSASGADARGVGRCGSFDGAKQAAEATRAALARWRKDTTIALLGLGALIEGVKVDTDGKLVLLSLHLSPEQFAGVATRIAGVVSATAQSLIVGNAAPRKPPVKKRVPRGR